MISVSSSKVLTFVSTKCSSIALVESEDTRARETLRYCIQCATALTEKAGRVSTYMLESKSGED